MTARVDLTIQDWQVLVGMCAACKSAAYTEFQQKGDHMEPLRRAQLNEMVTVADKFIAMAQAPQPETPLNILPGADA